MVFLRPFSFFLVKESILQLLWEKENTSHSVVALFVLSETAILQWDLW
jgi:hypothetical protein